MQIFTLLIGLLVGFNFGMILFAKTDLSKEDEKMVDSLNSIQGLKGVEEYLAINQKENNNVIIL